MTARRTWVGRLNPDGTVVADVDRDTIVTLRLPDPEAKQAEASPTTAPADPTTPLSTPSRPVPA